MKRNNLIAGITLTAGLAAGGIGGALLGIPGVSGAQTETTTPPAEQQQPVPPARAPVSETATVDRGSRPWPRP